MTRERILRAAAALAAGVSIAIEHLTVREQPEPPEPPESPVPAAKPDWVCPLCERPLAADSMHVHGQDVVWTTEVAGMVLFTEEALRDA